MTPASPKPLATEKGTNAMSTTSGTAALDEFGKRDKAVWDERGDHGRLLLALDAAKDDMPRALAALENVLGLADEWAEPAGAGSALEEDRMWIRQECADRLREVISAPLFAED